jgi:hypothetical protein
MLTMRLRSLFSILVFRHTDCPPLSSILRLSLLLHWIIIVEDPEMNLRAREQSYREDMIKAQLEMDETINCSLAVVNAPKCGCCPLRGLSPRLVLRERAQDH